MHFLTFPGFNPDVTAIIFAINGTSDAIIAGQGFAQFPTSLKKSGATCILDGVGWIVITRLVS
jgi:hypothetical protein